jgi:hypothetical protein
VISRPISLGAVEGIQESLVDERESLTWRGGKRRRAYIRDLIMAKKADGDRYRRRVHAGGRGFLARAWGKPQLPKS